MCPFELDISLNSQTVGAPEPTVFFCSVVPDRGSVSATVFFCVVEEEAAMGDERKDVGGGCLVFGGADLRRRIALFHLCRGKTVPGAEIERDLLVLWEGALALFDGRNP